MTRVHRTLEAPVPAVAAAANPRSDPPAQTASATGQSDPAGPALASPARPSGPAAGDGAGVCEHVFDYPVGTMLDDRSPLMRLTDARLPCSRCGQNPEPRFWESHCWHDRFARILTEKHAPCGRPARWRGRPDAPDLVVRVWRACDEHRQENDVLIEPEDA
jgi:hypothetical protein